VLRWRRRDKEGEREGEGGHWRKGRRTLRREREGEKRERRERGTEREERKEESDCAGGKEWERARERKGESEKFFLLITAPSLSSPLSPSWLSFSLKIICFSDWNIFYIFLIDIGSIPQQNLHNISFSSPSCNV
jgi:hypothetical protein